MADPDAGTERANKITCHHDELTCRVRVGRGGNNVSHDRSVSHEQVGLGGGERGALL